MLAIVSALRLKRSIKNLIVIPPLLWVGLTWPQSVALGFSLLILIGLSSSSYLINEYFDTEYDRYHPAKMNRPFISFPVKKSYVFCLAVLLNSGSLVGAFLLHRTVVLYAGLFIVFSLFYNVPPIRAKAIPYLDIFVESVNAPLRLVIAFLGVRSELPDWSWVILYFLLNYSLMGLKRYFELTFLGREIAARYRKVYRYYSKWNLLGLVSISFTLAVASAENFLQFGLLGLTLIYVTFICLNFTRVPRTLLS